MGVIDPEVEERDAGRGGFAVLAGAVFGDEFVGADDVLGAEVAGAHAVAAGKVTRHFVLFDDG